ncbi:MAG: class I SAM-dependent methyltransferase, partial [Ferruginibacter sp.]
MDAVELHDTNAGVFRKRYDDKGSFKDRLSVWTDLFKKYIQANSAVIELGCGPGLMAKEIIAMGNQLHAIDGSAKMIEQAKAEVGPSSQIRFTETYLSVKSLSGFQSASYDHAVSSSVLEYIKEADEIIEQ